jgi:hypothetical protein
MAVQYLESLDSVRTGPGSGVSDQDGRLAKLQTFLEVLMALALGREIVVPQSYAFDSGAFLDVASRVLTARPASSTDRPFRPHLFGERIRTFDDAVRAMLHRVHDPDRPFHSSLHPGINRLSREDVEEVVQDLDGRLVLVAGDLAKPLSLVLDEFRVTQPYVVPGTGGSLRLETVLAELVDPRSTLSSLSAGLLGRQRDVYERLRAAIRRLDPSQPATFGQRSRLRQDVPWPNDSRRRTAADIAGEDLPLVVEFVDTLYNRVVADSMGRPLALYSTTATSDDSLLEARYLAQELALGRPPLLVDPEGGDQDAPFFQVTAPTSTTRRDALLLRDLGRLFDTGTEALVPLMAARGRPDSQFWRGIAAMEAAGAADYERARDKHLTHVAKLLVGQVDISWAADAGISLALHATKEVIGPTDPTGSPPIVLDAAFHLADRAIKRTHATVSTRRVRGRLASAIGSLVPSSPPRSRE